MVPRLGVSDPWMFPPPPEEEWLMRERDERERTRKEYWAKKRRFQKEVKNGKAAQNVTSRVSELLYKERLADSSQE